MALFFVLCFGVPPSGLVEKVAKIQNQRSVFRNVASSGDEMRCLSIGT